MEKEIERVLGLIIRELLDDYMNDPANGPTRKDRLRNLRMCLERRERVLAIGGRSAPRRFAGRMSAFFRFLSAALFLVAFVTLVGAVSARARTIASFQADGDCYELATRFLREIDVPYIVSDDIKGMECHWNFVGDTQKDFQSWCRRKALTCGGKPFYVGFDSTWYAGERMPAQRAQWLREQQLRQDRRDSLSAVVPPSPSPVPEKVVTVEYLEIGKSTAERIGFKYGEYIASARFFDYSDLFSVTAQARSQGDTSYVYRTYTTHYDTTLHVFWGGTRDKLKHSTVTATGIVSNDYETETYGLTFDVQDMRYTYTHSTDFEHKIDGTGKLHFGENRIFGSYEYTYSQEEGVPFLSSIPGLGMLFRHVTTGTETRFVFILVTVRLAEVGDA